MEKEDIITIVVDGQKYDIILNNISDALYSNNLLDEHMYKPLVALAISQYSKNGKIEYLPDIDKMMEMLIKIFAELCLYMEQCLILEI